MENSQLLRKENSGYEEIYPLSFIQNIIDAETKEKLSDILIRYNHIYVPWQGDAERTRLSVPKLMRRKGLWISYDKEGTLYTEYFKLSTLDAMIDSYWESDDNWETVPNLEFVRNEASKLPDGIVTPEKLSPALQELIKQNNNITNLPDDEDLEEKCGVIKFKDRDYNPYISSGKGYKILRKNWVNGYNTLTQNMINKENTIYEIRYDFDLRGKEIIIPEGCILLFNGGSFDNGQLKINRYSNVIGRDSLLKINKIELYGNNKIYGVVVDGEWNNFGTYIYGSNVSIECCRFINNKYPDESVATSAIRIGTYYTIEDDNYSNINIINTIFDGCEPFDTVSQESKNSTVARMILIYNGFNINIESCKFKNLKGNYDSDMIQIHKRTLSDNTLPFFTATDQTGGTSPYKSIKYDYANSTIKNCIFYQRDYKSCIKIMGSGVDIINNTFMYDNNIYDISSRCFIRAYYCEDIIITNNNILLNGNNNVSYIFEINNAKNITVSGNKITGEQCNVSCIFFSAYNYKIFITNNTIICKTKSILYNEYNFDLYINNNNFTIYNDNIESNILFFQQSANHYTFPSIEHTHKISITNNMFDYIIKEDFSNQLNISFVYSSSINFINNDIFIKNVESAFNCSITTKQNFNSEINICNNHINKCHIIIETIPNSEKQIDTVNINGNNNITSAECLKTTAYFINKNKFTKSIKSYLNYIIRCIQVNECTINGNYFETDTIYTKLRIEKSTTKINLINNVCFGRFGIYLTDNGDYGGGIYIPSNIKVEPFDIGVEKDMNSLLSKFIIETGHEFYRKDLTNLYHFTSTEFVDEYGNIPYKKHGQFDEKPQNAGVGYPFLDRTNQKFIFKKYDTSNIWVDSDGAISGALRQGTFEQRPTTSSLIPIGFAYFCTDRQTSEGSTNGIMIYHKGADVWVDALGRVIS